MTHDIKRHDDGHKYCGRCGVHEPHLDDPCINETIKDKLKSMVGID